MEGLVSVSGRRALEASNHYSRTHKYTSFLSIFHDTAVHVPPYSVFGSPRSGITLTGVVITRHTAPGTIAVSRTVSLAPQSLIWYRPAKTPSRSRLANTPQLSVGYNV